MFFLKRSILVFLNQLRYVDKIVDFVVSSVSSFPHKKASKQLQHLGSNYIFYKTNARTTWYIFFEKRNQNYLITGITNNNCIEAKELLKKNPQKHFVHEDFFM
jgi:hypothetical protein